MNGGSSQDSDDATSRVDARTTRPTLRRTVALVKADLQARCTYEQKRLTALQLFKFLLHNAVVATIVFRLQVYLHRNGLRPLAALLKTFNAVVMTVDIDSTSEIGGGLFLMHANYICIGPRVTIGRNCTMAHQNSIAPSPFFESSRAALAGGPTLGDDIIIGAGACVSGEVTIGDRVRVSINAAVDQSFSSDVVLFGIPARVLAGSTARTAAE